MDEWTVLAHREGVMANLDAARAIQRRTKSLLWRYHHSATTKTPSPLGQPPAMISGRLAASVQADQDGDDAVVGPTSWASSKNGAYGRFLELGGVHAAHNDTGEMWWYQDGFWHHAAELEKGPRPFLKPATEQAIESGEIYDIYWRHWLMAQEAVTA